MMKFPEGIRHSVKLPEDRTLSYYTFQRKESPGSSDTTTRHPVLYLHGFPGCGLEGAVCADAVADAGCELFAPDRPGFGYSDPPAAKNLDEDERLSATVDDLWEFIRIKRWSSFSLIGVSGGGPYTLALLSSYLKKLRNSASSPPPAKLEAVSVVAGIYCSAGTDGMMPMNQELFQLVATHRSRCLSRTKLHITFQLPTLLVRLLPANLMMKLMPLDVPTVDKVILQEEEMGTFMINILTQACRQGSLASENEAKILFRSNPPLDMELQRDWKNAVDSGTTLPKVAIFQGSLDKNVPPSHSQYVYENLFQKDKNIQYTVYEDLGHVSLIGTRQSDYAKFPTNE